MRLFLLLSIPLMLDSCSTSLQTESDLTYIHQNIISENEKTLLINEYSPKSIQVNEYGEKADWIELYNASDSDLSIQSGEWSLSDDRTEPDKYWLPQTIIKSHSFLLIWCDDNRSSSDYFHAPFKLSPDGEELLLYRSGALVDIISYNDQVKKGRSYGRSEDGDSNWQKFDIPTPGKTNLSFDDYTESLK